MATLYRFNCKYLPRLGAAFVVAVVVHFCAPNANATLINIDDFALPSNAQFFVVPPGTNSTLQMTNVVNGPIGGQRDMLFHVVGPTSINSASGLVGHDSSLAGNAFQLGTVGTSPTVTTLQYSGQNNLNTLTSLVNAHGLGGGSGVDLTDGGTNNRFQFKFHSSDAQPTNGLDFALTITSPGGGTSTASAIVPNSLATFTFDLPFSQLVGNGSLNHVDSISMVFNGVRLTPNIDFEIQNISVVPEPLACVTMAIGGALLGALALKRRVCR